MPDQDFSGYVVDDHERGLFRVRRTAFTDPAVLERERREIFDRCWLYAAHESELPKPGDYLTRKVGGRPLIILRDQRGVIRVFLNTCTHRGNQLLREKSGNARVLSCFYHAWGFDLTGKLVGLPGDDAYTAHFDRDQMGLVPVPRLQSYRGMLFISYDAGIVDLVTYFGPAREIIDHMLDFGGDDVEIVPGAQSYSMRANWKLLVENSIDAYHAASTHARYLREYLPDIGMDNSKWVGLKSFVGWRGVALGNGHAMLEGPALPTPLDGSAPEELARIRADLDVKFGKERAHRIADYHRNLFIYPNLILISFWRTLRTFYPVSPDYMEVEAWGLLPRSESEQLRHKRIENFLSFLGPAGLATPDDVSALEGCQRGFESLREAPWSDISRGMGREQPLNTDEQQMRAFWRRWNAQLQGQGGDTDCNDHPERVLAAAASGVAV